MMKGYKLLLWFYKTEDGGRKTELNTFFPYRPVLFFDEKNTVVRLVLEKE